MSACDRSWIFLLYICNIFETFTYANFDGHGVYSFFYFFIFFNEIRIWWVNLSETFIKSLNLEYYYFFWPKRWVKTLKTFLNFKVAGLCFSSLRKRFSNKVGNYGCWAFCDFGLDYLLLYCDPSILDRRVGTGPIITHLEPACVQTMPRSVETLITCPQ